MKTIQIPAQIQCVDSISFAASLIEKEIKKSAKLSHNKKNAASSKRRDLPIKKFPLSAESIVRCAIRWLAASELFDYTLTARKQIRADREYGPAAKILLFATASNDEFAKLFFFVSVCCCLFFFFIEINGIKQRKKIFSERFAFCFCMVCCCTRSDKLRRTQPEKGRRQAE